MESDNEGKYLTSHVMQLLTEISIFNGFEYELVFQLLVPTDILLVGISDRSNGNMN